MFYTLLIVVVLGLAAVGWFTRGWWSRRRFASQLAQARQGLVEQQPQVERDFLEQASAGGKPRGLKWVDCDFHEGALLAYDRATAEIYALYGVTIRFEAIPGGGMEEVEAVGNLRYATAVLVFRDHKWTSDGRVVFNLSPQETLEKYHGSLTPLAT